MDTEVRQLQCVVMVMVPAGSQLNGNVVAAPDGHKYAVIPSLYRLRPVGPDEDRPHTVLGQEMSADFPAWNVEYVPDRDWPLGFDIDGAVLATFGPPLETRDA